MQPSVCIGKSNTQSVAGHSTTDVPPLFPPGWEGGEEFSFSLRVSPNFHGKFFISHEINVFQIDNMKTHALK